MRKTALTLFVALGAFCLPGTAFAEEVSARVGYGDLDLRDPADVKVLERRVKRAARSLCRAAATSALHPSTVDEVCFRDAAKRAVLEIERHRLRYAALDLGPAG